MTGQNVNKCTYDIPYWGPCEEENCKQHKDIKCNVPKCGRPAIKGCSNGTSLICGTPLCFEHWNNGICQCRGYK